MLIVKLNKIILFKIFVWIKLILRFSFDSKSLIISMFPLLTAI